jgi:carbamoyltransferase
MIILGVNAFHSDAAAALLHDGELVAAAEEERFRRIKHWTGFPEAAIAYCLAEAGISLGDVDHIAINQDSRAALWRKFAHLVRHSPRPALILEKLRNRAERSGLPELIHNMKTGRPFRGKFHAIEHHLSHLYSAYYVSPFQEAAILSIDGFGDFSSTAWGLGDKNDIDVHQRIYFPHSLGIFYQALTQYLGFPHYGDEYKVMGLAPYGSPAFLNEMRKIVQPGPRGSFRLDLQYFRHHKEEAYQAFGGAPAIRDLFSPLLEDLLGPRRQPAEPLTSRHRDIARSTQAMYEEVFFHIVRRLEDETRASNLALAGGCAANSVANGKVARLSKFNRVYVHPAPGDAGGAIGAAFAAWHKLGGPRTFVMDHAYWGPHFSSDAIAAIVSGSGGRLEEAGCTVHWVATDSDLCRRVATAIADGKVVGWFQGRMEWGPRALGNRSILCDPRRGDMKDVLNAKIKRRESFRPFAPSILETHVADWFEEDDPVPFMMQVYQVREGKRAKIPAVTHVDGSGRLQTVSRTSNPLYFQLIESFYELTSVPILLNTSFNENEPVVCAPGEALDCFMRTRMDMLVLGECCIERRA